MSLNGNFINACTGGDLDEVKTLLKRGVDIHAGFDRALRWAANNGHFDVVKYLVEHGADIHASGDGALRYAAWNEHLGVANYLRETAGEKYKCHECLIKSTCLELCDDFQAGEK